MSTLALKSPLQSKNGPFLVLIMSQKCDDYGTLISTQNYIPILNTRVYNVKFPDVHYKQYATNVLTESLTSSHHCDGYDKAAI